MTDKKLTDVKLVFERIIEKAEKIKANKKLTGDERGAIIKGLKKEFSDVLLDLEYIIDTPGYHEMGFEVQESFCLKAQDLNIIKDKEELDEIFMEIYKIKKAKREDGDELEEIKKIIDNALAERDLSNLALIWHDTLTSDPDKLAADTEYYLSEKLLEAGLEDEVEKLRAGIEKRAKEKRFREEERELKNHEARLRIIEREHKKEIKKEYAEVSKRAGSYYKTLDALYKDMPLAPVEFESPGFCQKCHKLIEETFYYYEPATGVMMHTDCAKKVFDIKKKEKK